MNAVRNLRVAIVCDWLIGLGGAERVVLELHHLYPDAPIYTSQYDPDALDWFKDADVRTGWLQKFPKTLRKFLPVLRAYYFSHLDLSEYDLVLSSSGAEAKGVRVKPGAIHINYCHSPTHYYWSRYESYMKEPGFGPFNWLARLGLRLLVGPMRRWDKKAAQRPTHIIANSTHIQKMIRKYYNRDSTVIFPPVDIDEMRSKNTAERSGFIVVGRQVPYKRIDLALAACSQLDLPLTVVGNGPDHDRLVKLAGPTVTFRTDVRDAKVKAGLLGASSAFIFPAEDDFGIAPVEAIAAGTPVIAYRAGGSLDYVVEGETGLFFDKQSVESLSEALKRFDPKKFDAKRISAHAAKFSVENFRKNIQAFIGDKTS